MSLVLLDSLSLPGDPAKPNEDAFAHSDHAALVMDGATPLGDPLMPGPSDAQWLAQFGARRLMAHLKDGNSPRIAITHALKDAEKSFHALRRHPIREKWQTPCASLILATQSKTGLDCFWFGDCSALLLHDGACSVIGEVFDKRGQEAQRAREIMQEGKHTPSVDFNRPKINNLMRASRNRINSGSYWLFSPNSRAAHHVAHAKARVSPGDLLLLASDGLLALATDYGVYDAIGLVNAAREKTLAGLGEQLRAIENADALGEKFARFKKSDDATALLLEIK